MANIHIYVEYDGGANRQRFLLPTDKAVGSLLRAIVSKLALPTEQEDGSRREYALRRRETRKNLAMDESLSDAGITEDQVLELYTQAGEQIRRPKNGSAVLSPGEHKPQRPLPSTREREEIVRERGTEKAASPIASELSPKTQEQVHKGTADELSDNETGADAESEREAQAISPPQRRLIWVAILGLGLGLWFVVWLMIPNADGGGDSWEDRARDCSTVAECHDLAMALRADGNSLNALQPLARAIDLVSPHEQPPHAFLWMTRGELNVDLGRIDEARLSFERCIEWTQGDPDLEPLRLAAGEFLGQL